MLILKGIETNNLKSVDVSIPFGRITAVVGGSGAGKTSLAFHSLYALCKNELDTISGIPATLKPKVQHYANLLPAVALKQKNANVNPRSSIFTYLGLDRLFLPLFLQTNPSITHNILAQNNPANYCERCEGLGTLYSPDLAKIVDVNTPLADKPFVSWNNFAAGHYYSLLAEFCTDHAIDTAKSISQLSPKLQDLLLNSSGEKLYPVKYKQNKRYRQKKFPYVGAFREIQDCCDNLHLPGNMQKIKSYIAADFCPQCKGTRFAPHLSKYILNGWTIHQILSVGFDELLPFIESISGKEFNTHKLESVVKNIVKNNLGYLSPMRSIPSLSGGEFQRLQLASVLSAEFTNLLYIIDEVSSSLHVSEYSNVLQQLHSLKERNSTIVLVEHALEFIEEADELIALEDGILIDSADWLREQRDVFIKRDKNVPNGALSFTVRNVHNIKHIDVSIPMGCLVGCCGISGSGKSSFAESISTHDDVEYISQGTIQGNSSSTVATYLKLMQPIDSFLSKKLGAPVKTFMFNSCESQCPACEGKGYMEQEASFNHRFRWVCDACEGKRYNPKALKYKFQSHSIADILATPVGELLGLGLFSSNKAITSKLLDMISIGLGHLTLSRPTGELSGGEAQRIKLLSQMKSNLKHSFLIIDEPANGLERKDTKLLVRFLDQLLPRVKGIMIIEHSMFLLRSMDYIVEFGPGGGDKGGRIIYEGTVHGMRGQDSCSILKNYL